MEHEIVEWDQGWDYIQKGITKLKRILEGPPDPPFSSEEYMGLYSTIYSMCAQKGPHNYAQQLYDKYRETFVEYITSTVLPSLREKHDEFMPREFVKRWENHHVMVRRLKHFFLHLESSFISWRFLPSLNEVGMTCYHDLIDKDREGEQIDRALLRNVIDIFFEVGEDRYEEDFEAYMLQETSAYYSRKASSWIEEYSCPDYMLKSEECLKKKVVEDRCYGIDATIMRVMKSRKVLGHQQLFSECIGRLSHMFKPDVKAIKKRVDFLISQNYLERDEENPNIFKYLS